jgi:GT2 family glycosyltransferase
MFKVSVVIPNWNGEHKLKKNLPKVLKVKNVEEIIVTDDASTDGSIELLEKEFPQVKLIKSNLTKNRGFSSNVNVGVKEAKGDLIFLLNTDAVPQADCLEGALPHFEDPQVFSVSCNTGGSWSWARWKDGFFWHYQSEEKTEASHQTLWASGGSGVFRKSIWDKLEGFDELFNPFYEEDLDLGYRATKRGYLNIWEPKALVEHYKEPGVIAENFSKTVISKTAQRNQLFFIWKNMTSNKLILEHKLALTKMLLTKPRYWSIFLTAHKHLNKILKERSLEKKETKVPDEEILSKFN